MTVSKMYMILGMAIIGGLTVAGVSADRPEPMAAAIVDGGHEGHNHGDEGDTAGHSGHAREMATYTFNGVVTAIDAAKSTITIKHEKIGDYMEAMTMPFDVASPSMLEGVKVGDEKSFTLHVNPSMTAIVGIGEPESTDATATASTKTHDKCASHKDGKACDHKDGEKCAEHKDGEKCAHEGEEGHGDGACCAKHAKDAKK